MTVKEHLRIFLDWKYNNKFNFFTSEVQNLSESGLRKFGKRLGSPGTYNRCFRQMRQDGEVVCKKLDSKGRQAYWKVVDNGS